MQTAQIIDMHSHLCFCNNATFVAEQCKNLDIGAYVVSVTPQEYIDNIQRLSNYSNIICALGAHPWWIAQGKLNNEDRQLFMQAIETTPYIGEVGLDFSKRFIETNTCSVQKEWFWDLCSTLAHKQDASVMSIHALQAEDACLDMLEKTKALNNTTCIFHWFSGTDVQLKRIMEMGCYISCNARMLQAKRWKAYARWLNPSQILLETDLPQPAESFNAQQEQKALLSAQSMLTALRADISLAMLQKNSLRVLATNNTC